MSECGCCVTRLPLLRQVNRLLLSRTGVTLNPQKSMHLLIIVTDFVEVESSFSQPLVKSCVCAATPDAGRAAAAAAALAACVRFLAARDASDAAAATRACMLVYGRCTRRSAAAAPAA